MEEEQPCNNVEFSGKSFSEDSFKVCLLLFLCLVFRCRELLQQGVQLGQHICHGYHNKQHGWSDHMSIQMFRKIIKIYKID